MPPLNIVMQMRGCSASFRTIHIHQSSALSVPGYQLNMQITDGTQCYLVAISMDRHHAQHAHAWTTGKHALAVQSVLQHHSGAQQTTPPDKHA